jgi:hypothetical protein
MSTVSRAALFLAAASLSAAASAVEGARSEGGESKAGRVRVLRSWPEPVTTNGKTALGRVEIAFDYDEGVTIERIISADGKVVSTRVRKRGEGTPRPTPEEIAEAMAIVRADAELSRIMDNASAELDGGFALNEEPGRACGPGTRCLQIQMKTADDGHGLVRWVVVDLTKGSLAYRAYGEGSR